MTHHFATARAVAAHSVTFDCAPVGPAVKRPRKRMAKLCAAVATTVITIVLATTSASAASWYGRPNTVTCVYTTAMIDGPTNVPLTGDVTWEATVHVWDESANNWRPDWSTSLTNRADSAGITAGPWYDADQIPTYVVSTGISSNSTEPVTIAVYNRFYSWDTRQWVDGFWSLSTLDGGSSCVLEGGGIVV